MFLISIYLYMMFLLCILEIASKQTYKDESTATVASLALVKERKKEIQWTQSGCVMVYNLHVYIVVTICIKRVVHSVRQS